MLLCASEGACEEMGAYHKIQKLYAPTAAKFHTRSRLGSCVAAPDPCMMMMMVDDYDDADADAGEDAVVFATSVNAMRIKSDGMMMI